MLIITNKQIRAFELVTFPAFDIKMRDYLKRYYKPFINKFTAEEISLLIRLGNERANKYNLQTSYEVGLFICVQLMLGSAFDKDANYLWAKKILVDVTIYNPTKRIEKLYQQVIKLKKDNL